MRIRTQEPKKNVDPIFVHFGTPCFPFSRGSVVKFLLFRSFLFLDDLSESFFMSIFPFSRRSFLFLDDLSDSFFMLISLSRRSVGKFSLCRSLFLDDLSESFFMSIFHNGRLRTMKANYRVAEGDLRIIRPLVYVREKHLRQFAESRKLPVIAENCPACFEVSR